MLRQKCRFLSTSASKLFQIPSNYKPNSRVVKRLPFLQLFNIWWNSLKPGRLEQLQIQLVNLLFPGNLQENAGVTRIFRKVPLDDAGNYINEVSFEVINDPKYTTKHVVFVHGYGASLGCFARNFHLSNRFKGLKHNYKVHFLDNISFGLSANPKLSSINYWKPIPRSEHITIRDTKPTDVKSLYKKYYKLVDSFDVDVEKSKEYKEKMVPLLKDIEDYYLNAIEAWRVSSRIDKIDFLVGHSFGGYWSGSYAVRNPGKIQNLVLLSPVGVERHAYSVTAPTPETSTGIQPTLDPSSNRFLSRYPILLKKTINWWYFVQPYLPRILKFLGPWGVDLYYDMWYSRLFAINRVIEKLGGEKVFRSSNELKYGTNSECRLLIEYLYNSITNGTVSDTHVKYLLTPATTSKWPLLDKFDGAGKSELLNFNTHVIYGQYDFMNSEAGQCLVKRINQDQEKPRAKFHTVAEGGHNLYIQNPFGTNEVLEKIILEQD